MNEEPAPRLSIVEYMTVARFDKAPPAPESFDATAAVRQLVVFLQRRRHDALRALRASTEAGADYWRWQGHAELSRQLLEQMGAEVPQ